MALENKIGVAVVSSAMRLCDFARYLGKVGSDGGLFACCLANGMTKRYDAIGCDKSCVGMDGRTNGINKRRERKAVPGRANGDVRMASEPLEGMR